MPDTYSVEPRTVMGKKVRRLRRDGVIPANIYGRGIESQAVQLPLPDVRTMLNEHGRNVLIEVHVGGEPRPRPVVIRNVDREPASGDVQHVDFFQVDLSRAIHADVPVVLMGEAPAVAQHGGILVQALEYVSVEALPSDLPEHLELSVERLEELDAQLSVGDIEPVEGVTVLSDPDIAVARISRPRLEVPEEEVPEGEEELVEGAEAEEAAEGEEAAPAEETSEGEAEEE